MAPKAKAVKKKEEVVEIPKPHLLPDGPKSYFIGGWSKHQSLTAVETFTKADPTLTTVYLLPGVIDETLKGTVTESVVPLGTIKLLGVLPSAKGEGQKPSGEGAADGEGGDGEGGAAAAEEEADGEKKPQQELTLYPDQTITVQGRITIEGVMPPVVVAPAPVVEAAETAAAPSKAVKGAKGKTAVVKDDAAEIAAREAAAAAAREKALKEQEKGAAPSKWPTIEIQNVFFLGEVSIKKAHVTFINCHFSGTSDENKFQAFEGNLVAVHQYCKVSFQRCTFSRGLKSGLYAYPKSIVTVNECVFSGQALPRSAEEPVAQGAFEAVATSVGIYADDAKLAAKGCIVGSVASGIIFHDKCEDSIVEKTIVRQCSTVGVYCHGTVATIRDSTVGSSGYYGLRFEGRCKGKVLRNNISSPVRIGEGAAPFLHTNALTSKLMDANEKGLVALEPKY
jgi:hypothetical protein